MNDALIALLAVVALALTASLIRGPNSAPLPTWRELWHGHGPE